MVRLPNPLWNDSESVALGVEGEAGGCGLADPPQRVRGRGLAGAQLAQPWSACNPRRLLTGPSNLVDPASSHMLVSKIKPCMSQFKLQYGNTVNGSLKQL